MADQRSGPCNPQAMHPYISNITGANPELSRGLPESQPVPSAGALLIAVARSPQRSADAHAGPQSTGLVQMGHSGSTQACHALCACRGDVADGC